MDASDAHLMHGIAAGDEAAFYAFYQRHLSTVMQVLYRMLREPADVEDVLQDTFTQIWHRSHQYDPQRASPAGYLTMVARSRALDLLRRRKPDPGGEQLDKPVDWDPTIGMARDESVTKVRSALSKLPPEQREVIRMAFLGGLTHEQIAHMLSVPLGTVKTRIRLGLRRLKSLMPGTGNGG
jgi:RNA polymerase sigma-70 factor (ECF subfamily)